MSTRAQPDESNLSIVNRNDECFNCNGTGEVWSNTFHGLRRTCHVCGGTGYLVPNVELQ